MDSTSLIIISISLVFSAFFSGIEIAFISANRLKLELDKKQGIIPARLIAHVSKKPSEFIGAMLVGNNIALVVYGIFMAILLEPFINQWINSAWGVLMIQTIVSTLLVLIAAEFLPKTVFIINPNKTLMFFAVPVAVFFYLIWPVMFVTIRLSELFLKLVLKVEISKEKPAFGKVDLDNYLKEATSSIDEEQEIENEVQIFQNALEFESIKIRECMVPRTDIVALDSESSVNELLQTFIETGYSKILIYKESIDNIIGYTHSYEIFKNPKKIMNILLPITIIPESMSAHDVLKSFTKEKKGVAVIVDEFGGTSGMVTLEDIVEEIFGEIEDEHDKEEFLENQISETEFHFHARLEIDYLNEKYKLKLPDSENYETLAGLVLNVAEHIPAEGEVIKLEALEIKVIRVAENKIEEVQITRIEQQQ